MTFLRTVLFALGTTILVSCGDPLSEVDRIGDVDGDAPQGVGFVGTNESSNPSEVTTDDVIPFGQFARNCTVRKRNMGTQVSKASGYSVYDTNPAATGPRTHFITGFQDRCARQFTGALVIFGDVGTHELVRYADVGIDQPYSITDEAYEVIKASFCRVGRTEPCGRRIDRLARTTSFVTIYESFGDNSRWVDALLHKGEIIAQDTDR